MERRSLWHRLRDGAFLRASLLTRGMTLGVRLVVIDGDRVLLVRHSYTPGWHLPGGGVDSGETLEQAAHRELDEEAGLRAIGPLALHGVFQNRAVFARDHVAVYRVAAFERLRDVAPNLEIVETGFFSLAALPEGTTRGTRARLDEIDGGAPPSPYWT